MSNVKNLKKEMDIIRGGVRGTQGTHPPPLRAKIPTFVPEFKFAKIPKSHFWKGWGWRGWEVGDDKLPTFVPEFKFAKSPKSHCVCVGVGGGWGVAPNFSKSTSNFQNLSPKINFHF